MIKMMRPVITFLNYLDKEIGPNAVEQEDYQEDLT
jgi:hypothetical protein